MNEFDLTKAKFDELNSTVGPNFTKHLHIIAPFDEEYLWVEGLMAKALYLGFLVSRTPDEGRFRGGADFVYDVNDKDLEYEIKETAMKWRGGGISKRGPLTDLEQVVLLWKAVGADG